MYKAPDGSSFGTKNLLDHVKSCSVYLCVRRMSLNFAAVRDLPKLTLSSVA